MRTENVHTLILGAGPSGLAAGYMLARAGCQPVILEKEKVPGGLMRSIQRGDFIVDVGRKELYNRLERVDTFWNTLLGEDYRSYPHRGGILYDGHIIDMMPTFQGFRRGMPWSMFMGCAANFFLARAKPGQRPPRTVEEYFYQKRGSRLTRVFAQGFQEKLTGKKWADLPMPENAVNGTDAGLFSTVSAIIQRSFSKSEVNTFKGIWKHPARGTGQICDLVAQRDDGKRRPIRFRRLAERHLRHGRPCGHGGRGMRRRNDCLQTAARHLERSLGVVDPDAGREIPSGGRETVGSQADGQAHRGSHLSVPGGRAPVPARLASGHLSEHAHGSDHQLRRV